VHPPLLLAVSQVRAENEPHTTVSDGRRFAFAGVSDRFTDDKTRDAFRGRDVEDSCVAMVDVRWMTKAGGRVEGDMAESNKHTNKTSETVAVQKYS